MFRRRRREQAGRLLKDPDDPSKRILSTGDLVRQRPDGLLVFVGRGDDQVKVRGQRIELAEIESVLCGQNGVRQAVIVARDVVRLRRDNAHA